MRASVNTRYGSPDILEMREVPTPSPGPGEVLVRVHATTVTRTDTCALRAHPWFVRPVTGWLKPKNPILGLDFAGTVEKVGPDTVGFTEGMRVFGLTPGGNGAHAEYLVMKATGMIAAMPDGLAFREAVLCEGAWYANTYLKAFGLRRGHTILIYGGSGAIGTAAIQLAKAARAEVTAVVPGKCLDLAKDLGADHVIDYQTQDFTQTGARYDFVLDAVGKTTYAACKPLLAPHGVFAATDLGPYWQNIFLPMWFQAWGKRRVIMPMPGGGQEVVRFIKDRIEAGQLRAVIDRVYPFDQIADAYRYVETKAKVGIVVVEVIPEA